MRVGLITDSHVVTRYKTTKESGYTLGEIGNQAPTKFTACAANQPEEIRQAINLPDICFQGQHDTPYLLGMTPGQIAKEINKVVDLSVIDTAIGTLKQWVSAAKILEADSAKRVATAAEDLASMYWVPKAEEDWARIQELDNESQKLYESQKSLILLRDNILELDAQVRSKEALAEPLELIVAKLGMLAGDIARTKQRHATLESLHSSLVAIQTLDRKVAAKAILEGLVGIGLERDTLVAKGKKLSTLVKQAKTDEEEISKKSAIVESAGRKLSSLSDLRDSKNTFREKITRIEEHVRQIETLDGQILLGQGAWEVQHEELTTLQKKLENEKPKCPTCGRAL